jgi:hypothetical protein
MMKKNPNPPNPSPLSADEVRAWLSENGFQPFKEFELFISPASELQEYRQCWCGSRDWLLLKTIRRFKDGTATPVDVFVVCAKCRELCSYM